MVAQVLGTTFRYSHTIGRGEQRGPGFRTPVSMAVTKDDLIYVVSRASEYRPDSMRITMCVSWSKPVGGTRRTRQRQTRGQRREVMGFRPSGRRTE
jgi:hypothetical protein